MMVNNDIRIGPAGNDKKFYADGNASSVDAPKWLRGLGLNAYEISFGLGIRMTDKTARIIGEKAKEFDVQISVHAPYYINLANTDILDKSYNYIKKSLDILQCLGGQRLVVHVGSQMKMNRSTALANCRKNLAEVIKRLDADGIHDFLLCIETMGKYGQIGNVEEICDLCSADERVVPTLDFGHINCLMQGQMDILKVFETVEKKIGTEKLNKVHIHLSFIEFGPGGEIRHMTLADRKWGFDINQIAGEIKRRQIAPTVICESAGVMARDAVEIKKMLDKTKSF
jgi:deoxyribonuclease-4